MQHLPEGFRFVSPRFRSRFEGRFGYVALDRTLPFHPGIYDTPEQSKEKVLEMEKHFHKLGGRVRRDRAITGKAGRPALPETVALYELHFVQKKPWPQCFAELWAAPGRKPPVPHERQRVMRRLRNYAKAYAAQRDAEIV
jgi:hypothetical protein